MTAKEDSSPPLPDTISFKKEPKLQQSDSVLTESTASLSSSSKSFTGSSASLSSLSSKSKSSDSLRKSSKNSGSSLRTLDEAPEKDITPEVSEEPKLKPQKRRKKRDKAPEMEKSISTLTDSTASLTSLESSAQSKNSLRKTSKNSGSSLRTLNETPEDDLEANITEETALIPTKAKEKKPKSSLLDNAKGAFDKMKSTLRDFSPRNLLAKHAEPSQYKESKESSGPIEKAQDLYEAADKKNNELYASRMTATVAGAATALFFREGWYSSPVLPIAMASYSAAWGKVTRDANALSEIKGKHAEAVEQTGLCSNNDHSDKISEIKKNNHAADGTYDLSYYLGAASVYAGINGYKMTALGCLAAGTVMQAGSYTSKLMMERQQLKATHSPIEEHQGLSR